MPPPVNPVTLEPLIRKPENLLARPTLSGTMRESPLYRTLGVGLTDRLYLIGHADGIALNDPFQVASIQRTVDYLGADTKSPLLRGLLEAYYAGARDIWIVAAAPMSEYVEGLSDRFTTHTEWSGRNFYQQYKVRLDATYAMLQEWDLPQIVCPLEAPFYYTGNVDFLTQLSHHCQDAFNLTQALRLGVLGTRIAGGMTKTHIDAMAADTRPDNQGPGGKFVSVVVGEGTISLKELPTTYSCALNAVASGILSALPLGHGWIYRTLDNVVGLTARDLKASQVEALAENKLNPVIRTTLGRRGQPFSTVIATDNTVVADGSDYWSFLQIRLVLQIIEVVRFLGNRYIGTISYGEYKRSVEQYMFRLLADDVLRGYTLNIAKDPKDQKKALVDIAVQPFFGVRELNFSVTVGPQLT